MYRYIRVSLSIYIYLLINIKIFLNKYIYIYYIYYIYIIYISWSRAFRRIRSSTKLTSLLYFTIKSLLNMRIWDIRVILHRHSSQNKTTWVCQRKHTTINTISRFGFGQVTICVPFGGGWGLGFTNDQRWCPPVLIGVQIFSVQLLHCLATWILGRCRGCDNQII